MTIRKMFLILALVTVNIQFPSSHIQLTARRVEDTKMNFLLAQLYRDEVPCFITIETIIENTNSKDTLCLVLNRERINNPQFTLIVNGKNKIHQINRGRKRNPFPQFDTIHLLPQEMIIDTLTFAIDDSVPKTDTIFIRLEFNECNNVMDSVTSIVKL